MKFRTEIKAPFVADLVNYQSKIMTIGSCFADNIGGHLREYEFSVESNPFGVIFNPVSILRLLTNSAEDKINRVGFIQRDSNFYHYDFHSKIHSNSQEGLASEIISRQQKAAELLKNGDLLIITFGTAWVYRHIQTNEIVANCHKIPQAEFKKRLLDLEELKRDYTNQFGQLFKQNPKLKIILTVSPVRHIKDGLHENNLSKSILLLLADHLKRTFPQVFYFPAYEIVMDDLRDYRFFKEDLIHPTEQAIKYVFEKFSESYFSEKTKKGVELKTQILKMESHRFLGTLVSPEAVHVNKIAALHKEFDSLKKT